MSGNPFDDENGTSYVPVNDKEQHSLWPAFREVPQGWRVVFGADGGRPRRERLDHVERHWTDLRPKSLRERLAANTAS